MPAAGRYSAAGVAFRPRRVILAPDASASQELPVNDRDALFAAILKHPDEDTPRLAFADWLDEHGDASYAKFIRKQIELAKVPEWDPLWIEAWEHDRDALTGNGREEFVPKLPEGLEWPALTDYRRGFLWHVESIGTEPFLGHADKLAATVPLQALTVRRGNDGEDWRDPIDLKGLLAAPHMARLRHLGFSLVNLSGPTVRRMQACPRLRNLTALRFEFAAFGPGALRALLQPPLVEQLEALHFENSPLDWGLLARGLANAGGPYRLRRLHVSNYYVGGPVSPRAFEAPLLRGLKELVISEFGMDAPAVRKLCASPVVNGLESLTLNKVRPGAPGIAALAECAALRGLKRLSLRLNSIGAVAAKHLARSPHLSGLQVLDLESNPLRDKGAIALAEAPCMPNLVSLKLMHCEIGDAGATALMNALSADKVITLVLHSDKVKLSAGVKRKLRKKFGDRVWA
jgi:uncharacterized protein (TIGR02996 family)